MNSEKIITSIDIGTSKISILVCEVISANNIQVLGMGTSILRGVKKGIIKDRSLFYNAMQNALKRAQVSADITIKNVVVNVPCGNTRFTIQTGILQNNTDRTLTSKDKEATMKKAIHCINKKDQSVLHVFPLNYRLDGQSTEIIENQKFNAVEIDTGVILCDTKNLNTIVSCFKQLDLKIKGIISDFLSLGAILLPESKAPHLIIDFGAQTTNVSIYKTNQLLFAQTIQIGSEQITEDLSICLKCSHAEAERIKVLHGQLQKSEVDLSKTIKIQCYDGQKTIKLSLVTSVIESRMNQLIN